MGDRSKIEWTDATLNPVRARNCATGAVGWYCEHASPGCRRCYAEGFNANRLGTRLPFKPGHRDDVEHFLDEAILTQPLRWRRPRRIFLGSMTDLFGDWVTVPWLDQIFAVAALCPQHTLQVLTKRSGRMRAYLSDPMVRPRIAMAMARITARGTIAEMERGRQIVKGMEGSGWPLPNVWVGVSAEDQRRADERVPDLLATPAAVRFVSAEPLLGPIEFAPWLTPAAVRHHPDNVPSEHLDALVNAVRRQLAPRLDQIIVGGESGLKARAMHPTWVREICDQCAVAGVAFYFKQWGAWQPREWCRDGGTHAMRSWGGQESFQRIQSHPDSIERVGAGPEWSAFALVGKKAAGRLLDGVEHNGMPEVRP